MKIQLITACATLLIAVPATAAAPQIGKPAPAFSVKDSNGTSHNLLDYMGKTLVLEWSNDQCAAVRQRYDRDEMQALQRQYAEQGVVWLTVISSANGKPGQLDGASANELTRHRNAAPTAVLLDEPGAMGRAYDARITPQLYVINREGMLMYMGAIDSAANDDPAADATPYFRDAANAVLANQPVPSAVTKPHGCPVEY